MSVRSGQQETATAPRGASPGDGGTPRPGLRHPVAFLRAHDPGLVTLKRAVEKPYSDSVQTWLRQVAAQWRSGGDLSAIAKTVTIDLLDVYLNPDEPACSWTLANAFPAAWSGPSLSVKSGEIASETLVLEHEGFLRQQV